MESDQPPKEVGGGGRGRVRNLDAEKETAEHSDDRVDTLEEGVEPEQAFGFLFSSFWRFMFYIIMGSMAWSYGGILGKVVGISWIVVAVFNTYIIMRYPSYRKMRDQIAEEEDKRIEGRISKQVRKQAFSSIIPGRGKK